MESPVILITGGSRGLGLALAMEWARACEETGARILLCARDARELDAARDKLSGFGLELEVFTRVCDLRDREQVRRLVLDTVKAHGRIDILVNNAGVIEAGPIASLDEQAFADVIESNLMSMIRMTLACLPHMRRGARIVNITSIGGAVAVPHLLSYSVSKFGALGFSLGLDAELAGRGISVTSVLPGLMRIGSYVHARFRGSNARNEYKWFAAGSSAPGLTISADHAARIIVSATMRRKRFVVVGPQAKLARLVYQLFPNLSLRVARQVTRLLPRSRHGDSSVREGKHLKDALPPSATRLGEKAGRKLNEDVA